MKIIFNSDLLYATSLIKDNLPRQVDEFLNACLENGHEIVIPLTTLLEFDKKQGEFANKEITTLRNASSKLSSYGINLDDFDLEELVQYPDLIQLINAIGITCNIERPSYADFENAHRKACTRESPHPPDTKSDEMRDLVIWEIAIRLANDNDGAILMSRDEVHTHYRGDKEASACNLIRCDSFERAFETLNIETKSASLIKSLVKSSWEEIVRSDFPVVDGGQIVSIKSPSFIDTSTGSSVASCGVRFDSGDGKDLAASMKIEYVKQNPFKIQLSDIRVDNNAGIKNIELNLGDPVVSDTDISEIQDSLKEIIKGYIINLNMGSQHFENVEIPLLWGKRAILQDTKGRISIIALDGNEALIEVLGDKPAPNIHYELIDDGFKIIIDGEELYTYEPTRKIVTGLVLKLPECEIQSSGIRVGTNIFSGNMVMGFGVGIVVDERGIGMGAPLPEGLAKLVV